MRAKMLLGGLTFALLTAGCAELDELVATGATEGKALFQRLRAAVDPAPPDGAGAVISLDSPDDPSAASGAPDPSTTGSWGRAVAPGALGHPGARTVTGPGTARERFLAAYALLGCAQAATSDPVERERRRAEIFRRLNYSNFAWLDDLQTYGAADGEALRALCRP